MVRCGTNCGKVWQDVVRCGKMWQVVASCGLELWSVVATTTHHSKGATFVVSCGGLATTHHNPPQLTTTRCGELWQVVAGCGSATINGDYSLGQGYPDV